MKVYIDGKAVELSRKNSIGVGGEAEVFLYKDKAVKVYHKSILTTERKDKLTNFPDNLPDNVLSPQSLVRNKAGHILGYTMDAVFNSEVFAMLSNKRFRKQFQTKNVNDLFIQAYYTLKKLHSQGVIVGDYNDLNLLFVSNGRTNSAYYIDADSMQFGKYPCMVATEQYLDPQLYGKDLSSKPLFTRYTDYYSFTVMLFRSLLFVSPYGGIHKQYPTFLKRAEAGVSVFSKDVAYPKAALPFKILPDDLLQEFYEIFEKRKREDFPINLIEQIEWKKCTECGLTHSRNQCPCKLYDKEPVLKARIIVNRSCQASIIFQTKGKILFTKQETANGKLKYIYQEHETLKREDGSIIMKGVPDKDIHFDIMGNTTIITRRDNIALINSSNIVETSKTELCNNHPALSSTGRDYFRIVEGVLMNRNSIVANVLENQTWIKTGNKYGFGFYRVGLKTNFFTFPTTGAGITDINLPDIEGKLIEADCHFSETHFLVLLSTMDRGKKLNIMYLLTKEGELLAQNKENALDSEILSTIQGKGILGNKVITTTDEGLLLLDNRNGKMESIKLFKDTEPFVNTECQIYPASGGVYVVSGRDIKLLELN